MKRIVFALLFYLVKANLFAFQVDDYYQLALSQYLGNHYSNAVPNLKWAIKLDENNWRAHQLLGYCDYMLQDKVGALEECQKSLKHHGDNPRLENFVGSLNAKGSGEKQKDGQYYFGEGKAEAQMPMPPDQDPGRKPDLFIEGLVVQTPPSKMPEVLFMRIGGGLIFSEEFNTSGGVDQSINGNPGLAASVAVGTDCPDHFSFFASGEWLSPMLRGYSAGDGAIMANTQYTIPNFNGIEPYLYAGLGIDIGPQDPLLGLGLQCGAGSEFEVSPKADFFIEGKIFKGLGFSLPEKLRQELYFPVFLAGLKLKL
jgi:hypothetical protein